MTFLRNATTLKNRTSYINKFHQYATLQGSGLCNRAVDSDSIPIIDSTHYKKRPCLYTSHSGSITIEAALSLSIFILISLSLTYIINIMYLQTSLQIALEETVRDASGTAYITAEFYSLSAGEQSDAISKDSSVIENIGAKALSASYFRHSFLIDHNREILNNSCIKDGENGISFLSSSIDSTSDVADIILSYTVTIPFIPENIFSLNLTNRCYVRLYTGMDMSKEQTPSDVYVYYTVHGNVFHLNRYCRYLINYTEAVRYNTMDKTLLPCSLCCTATSDELATNNPIVYITQSNYCFHTTLKCQSFTDGVFRANYSSLDENDNICKECLKGK